MSERTPSEPTWKQVLEPRIDAAWAERDRRLRGPDRAAQAGAHRGQGLRRDAPAPRRLRAALRQRPSRGRHLRQAARLRRTSPPRAPTPCGTRPGMMRIKIPFGGVSPEQLEVLADLAEEYSDGILHVTTRQDIQLHFVHIEDTPDLMRRLAAVGITTREACGNSVRNVTGCPRAGVCHTESFDVSPYAKALMLFLLGHPDVQDFGRKFKPAFSGCQHEACGLVQMHDVGYVAQDRERQARLQVRGGRRPRAGAPPGQGALRVHPRGRAAAGRPRRCAESSRGSARSRTAVARASSSWWRSSASRSSAGWWTRSARRCPTTIAGPPS